MKASERNHRHEALRPLFPKVSDLSPPSWNLGFWLPDGQLQHPSSLSHPFPPQLTGLSKLGRSPALQSHTQWLCFCSCFQIQGMTALPRYRKTASSRALGAESFFHFPMETSVLELLPASGPGRPGPAPGASARNSVRAGDHQLRFWAWHFSCRLRTWGVKGEVKTLETSFHRFLLLSLFLPRLPEMSYSSYLFLRNICKMYDHSVKQNWLITS